MIMKREWTEKDEKELNEAMSRVEKLKSKKAMIERVKRKQWEDKHPSRYFTNGPSKYKCIL